MTKEVIVSISGLQLDPGNEEQMTEMVAPGEYFFRNGKHYVLYDEIDEDTKQVTKNVVKFTEGFMEVTKKGYTTSHMTFEKAKKTVTYYYTPYGGINVGIDTKRVEFEESDMLIKARAEYNLEINYEHVAECTIDMTITSKASRDFKLL